MCAMPIVTHKEPEESIEAALCALLSANCSIPVEGAMTPASDGCVKRASADTFVSVFVDQSSQDMDFKGPRVPHSYSARIIVHYALADDCGGSEWRDECRVVRAVLESLTGDGCADLGADGFACDAFVVDSTTTSFEAGDNPTNVKTYTATVRGRTINNTTTEAE